MDPFSPNMRWRKGQNPLSSAPMWPRACLRASRRLARACASIACPIPSWACSGDAFPDQTFAGVISRIEPFTETQNGVISYPVTIQLLDNALDSVLPGMTAVAALRREAASDRWLVPSTAIQEVDGATVVTVVRGQERLPLAVTPEDLHGEWTIVRSAGLQDGDEVAGAIASFGEE